MTTPRCPKCSHAMDEGFLLDVAQNCYLQSQWVAGAPRRSRWFGLRLRGAEKRNVATFCCSRCGFLESYAKPDEA